MSGRSRKETLRERERPRRETLKETYRIKERQTEKESGVTGVRHKRQRW
jgi:hypothetical protein